MPLLQLLEHQFSERSLDCLVTACVDVNDYYGDVHLSYCNSEALSDYYGDLETKKNYIVCVRGSPMIPLVGQ